jgi:hypothetical protein
MPATSLKQKNFMDAVAHNPAFAEKVGVPQSVGQDFSESSKGMKFKKSASGSRPDLQKVNKPTTLHGKNSLFAKGGSMATKKMMAFEKSGKDVEMKGVKEGSKADMAMDKKQMAMKKGGGVKKMASGGSASSRADGIAQRGKTKGKFLAKGGKV